MHQGAGTGRHAVPSRPHVPPGLHLPWRGRCGVVAWRLLKVHWWEAGACGRVAEQLIALGRGRQAGRQAGRRGGGPACVLSRPPIDPT
ncbi:hypothetical protein E2C01_064422 [Portunus trituberculatus]|uniref:Uncharacterized protein n=1 Tax=Portunus trituberculatus TaxID=210409 RepID=A0A5B7HG56_PORTR|nr:hypothetical protein [Portunus trituberculatus]